MKTMIGKLCTFLGAVLVMAALGLFAWNGYQQSGAEEASVAALHRVAEVVKNSAPRQMEPVGRMRAVEIDGEQYIGILGIPALELELPVLADWDYKKLNIALCRYSGDLYGGGLVVMAHNYQKHFGRLSSLKAGDTVTFTDMDGRTVRFRAEAMEILEAAAVEEMTAQVYDLTLFTCTYGGKDRVTVRCTRVEE